MNILEKVIADKRMEVEFSKKEVSISQLEQSIHFGRNTFSLYNALKNSDSPSIIAEFKRKSPSAGILNNTHDLISITQGYQLAGASALSILTDNKYFGGTNDDIIQIRESIDIPVLRKEFIIDEYQVIETKAVGGDLILLIASCLTSAEIKQFSKLAKSIGLEVLLEVRDAEELVGNMYDSIDFIGVNNRNLKTLETNISQSEKLVDLIPDNFIKISESGLKDADTIRHLHGMGYKGFLIGESFLKQNDPSSACLNLMNGIKITA